MNSTNGCTKSRITDSSTARRLVAGLVSALSLTLTAAAHAEPHGGAQDPSQNIRGVVLQGTITKISDGDTVHFVPDALRVRSTSLMELFQAGNGSEQSNKLSVRMVGIDTPELHLPIPGGMGSQGYWAEEAQRVLADLIPVGTHVELETYGTDVHGRTLGRVINDGHDVHEDLVEQGLAVTYQICQGPSCNKNFYAQSKFRRYRELCQEAVDESRGIYQEVGGLPELPFEYRLRMQKRTPDKWVANARTKELFAPENYKQVPVCERIFFPVRAEAEALGYELKP